MKHKQGSPSRRKGCGARNQGSKYRILGILSLSHNPRIVAAGISLSLELIRTAFSRSRVCSRIVAESSVFRARLAFGGRASPCTWLSDEQLELEMTTAGQGVRAWYRTDGRRRADDGGYGLAVGNDRSTSPGSCLMHHVLHACRIS